MSFITTGFRELTLKVRRQKTRIALKHEKRHLQKSEIALGREGTAEAAKFPEVRNEIVALKKLEQEQKEVAVRIAKIEEALKQIDLQRQENSREQAAALGQAGGRETPAGRSAATKPRSAAERCAKELATVDRPPPENDADRSRPAEETFHPAGDRAAAGRFAGANGPDRRGARAASDAKKPRWCRPGSGAPKHAGRRRKNSPRQKHSSHRRRKTSRASGANSKRAIAP